MRSSPAIGSTQRPIRRQKYDGTGGGGGGRRTHAIAYTRYDKKGVIHIVIKKFTDHSGRLYTTSDNKLFYSVQYTQMKKKIMADFLCQGNHFKHESIHS